MNGISYARIFSRIINVPLLCHPRAAINFYNGLCGNFGTVGVEVPEMNDGIALDNRQLHRGRVSAAETDLIPRASRFDGSFVKSGEEGFPSVEPFKMTSDGVAVISVVGELVNRGAWIGSNSGMVSHEGIRFQLDRAARSSKTKSIVLDIESPGGEGLGAFALADFVRKVNAEKPVFAVVNAMAASGGYSLASGAKRIITDRSGMSGSIGVVLLHLDHSKRAENLGIKPTLIFAGAHKVDGNPFEPLTDSVEGELQGQVNAFYQDFIGTVAAGRGRRLSMKAARETEARMFTGAAAIEAGLADAVGTFHDVLGEANDNARRSNGRASAGRVNHAAA